jgi:hypothetical protein
MFLGAKLFLGPKIWITSVQNKYENMKQGVGHKLRIALCVAAIILVGSVLLYNDISLKSTPTLSSSSKLGGKQIIQNNVAAPPSHFGPQSDQIVRVLIPIINNPMILWWHVELFHRNLEEKSEIFFFNDADSKDMRSEIFSTCNSVKNKWRSIKKVSCIEVPQNIPRTGNFAAAKAADIVQFIYDNYIYDKLGFFIYQDSDFFLRKRASYFDQILHSKVAAVMQTRGESNQILYFFTGLMFFNGHALRGYPRMKIGYGTVDGIGTDNGGHTHFWIKEATAICQKNPAVRCGFETIWRHIPELPYFRCAESKYVTTKGATYIFLDQRTIDFFHNDYELVGQKCLPTLIGQHFEWIHMVGAGNWLNLDSAKLLKRLQATEEYLQVSRIN